MNTETLGYVHSEKIETERKELSLVEAIQKLREYNPVVMHRFPQDVNGMSLPEALHAWSQEPLVLEPDLETIFGLPKKPAKVTLESTSAPSNEPSAEEIEAGRLSEWREVAMLRIRNLQETLNSPDVREFLTEKQYDDFSLQLDSFTAKVEQAHTIDEAKILDEELMILVDEINATLEKNAESQATDSLAEDTENVAEELDNQLPEKTPFLKKLFGGKNAEDALKLLEAIVGLSVGFIGSHILFADRSLVPGGIALLTEGGFLLNHRLRKTRMMQRMISDIKHAETQVERRHKYKKFTRIASKIAATHCFSNLAKGLSEITEKAAERPLVHGILFGGGMYTIAGALMDKGEGGRHQDIVREVIDHGHAAVRGNVGTDTLNNNTKVDYSTLLQSYPAGSTATEHLPQLLDFTKTVKGLTMVSEYYQHVVNLMKSGNPNMAINALDKITHGLNSIDISKISPQTEVRVLSDQAVQKLVTLIDDIRKNGVGTDQIRILIDNIGSAGHQPSPEEAQQIAQFLAKG